MRSNKPRLDGWNVRPRPLLLLREGTSPTETIGEVSAVAIVVTAPAIAEDASADPPPAAASAVRIVVRIAADLRKGRRHPPRIGVISPVLLPPPDLTRDP